MTFIFNCLGVFGFILGFVIGCFIFCLNFAKVIGYCEILSFIFQRASPSQTFRNSRAEMLKQPTLQLALFSLVFAKSGLVANGVIFW